MADDTAQPSEGKTRAVINPEWLALEGKPHGELLLNEDSYRCLTTLPPRPCVWCGKETQPVKSFQFFDGKTLIHPICPKCWETKTVNCAECEGKGQVDSGAPTPMGGWFSTLCPICGGRGRITLEEDAALRNTAASKAAGSAPKPHSDHDR